MANCFQRLCCEKGGVPSPLPWKMEGAQASQEEKQTRKKMRNPLFGMRERVEKKVGELEERNEREKKRKIINKDRGET